MKIIRTEGGYRFQKNDRLITRTDFQQLNKQGRKAHTHYFTAIYEKNAKAHSRIGITVSRKVGKAVQRNRIKRIVREYFRLNRHLLRNQLNVHVIAKKSAASGGNTDLSQSLEHLFKKVDTSQAP